MNHLVAICRLWLIARAFVVTRGHVASITPKTIAAPSVPPYLIKGPPKSGMSHAERDIENTTVAAI